ncbi:MAG TPA: type III pantothenate kinase [Candidatus Bathyarchaeia archaeon]|nr:type III pantothenate kinase [Candidatus Bathyarchaeia archaeon]
MARILALDRGNSALKIALFDSGEIVGRWTDAGSSPETFLDGIAREIALASAGSAGARVSGKDRSRLLHAFLESVMFHSAIVSSVDSRRSSEIRRVLERMGVSRILEVSSRMKLPFKLLTERLAKLGPDRLAAAAGAAALGAREAVIVDAGTAITIDVLSKGGFLGGSIVPGRDLMYRALHEGTSALPLVSGGAGTLEPPGRNTRDAILSGVQWGAVGAVKEIIRRSRPFVSRSARIWVTGGGGAALAPHLGKGARHEPDLVFRGLHHLFELNSR